MTSTQNMEIVLPKPNPTLTSIYLLPEDSKKNSRRGKQDGAMAKQKQTNKQTNKKKKSIFRFFFFFSILKSLKKNINFSFWRCICLPTILFHPPMPDTRLSTLL